MELEEMEMEVDTNLSTSNLKAMEGENNPLNRSILTLGELQEKQTKVEAELSRLRLLPSASSYRVHREKVALKCLELIELCLSFMPGYQNQNDGTICTKNMNGNIKTNGEKEDVNVIAMENELASLLGSLSI